MELRYIIQLIVAIGTMAGVAKVVYELSIGGKLRLREEYRFAKEFLKDLEVTPKLHHLAEERGYYALAGTSSMEISEIKYLVSLTGADRRLKDYVLARKYVVLNERRNKIDFREKYKVSWSRTWRKYFYVLSYIIGCLLSFSPLLVIQPLGISPKYILLIFLTLPCFGFFAVDFMRSFVKISRGEVLIIEQQEHIPRIHIEKERKKVANTVI
ncbi:hypothetical protein [Pseudomonas syringae group genomosp. 3]|uniref:hypothetical protein n=1 Tax=Pseudomonas syringae group genomosp. 3 TaxID=251701 RepID=UPI000EFFEA92|nr:hypothetical protein [Pseudomonas syringae group genomosp. 3]RMP68472.1 hypothetical protein ALQ19_200047 [Pseudomonas syringae pv. berberidis]